MGSVNLDGAVVCSAELQSEFVLSYEVSYNELLDMLFKRGVEVIKE